MTERTPIRTNKQKMNKTSSFSFIRNINHSLLWAALGGALLCTAPAPARADGLFLVVPPNLPTFGATYGEWSARWWQWFYMLPKSGCKTSVLPTGLARATAAPADWARSGSRGNSDCHDNRRLPCPGWKGAVFPMINPGVFDLEGPPI